MPFTQSPIEATIWTVFVELQEWIAATLLQTAVFKAAVVTWIGILFVRAIAEMMTSGMPGLVLGRFVTVLACSALGTVLLKAKASADFRPINARQQAWSEASRVRAAGKYQALTRGTKGLHYYVLIHRGVAAVGDYIASQVATLFKNRSYQEAPYLLVQTLAQTAGATLDDPAAVTSLSWLFEHCTDRREAVVVEATASYAALFDLASPDCRERYAQLRQELSHWAQDKWGSSAWNASRLAIEQLGAKLGFVDEATLQNKLIASAVLNLARSRLGQNIDNVHTGALLSRSDAVFGNAATAMVALDNAVSFAGLTNGLLNRLTGTDFVAADGRNKSAALYNKIVQYLPPIRGYAKGLVALAFSFAAASLCFGTWRFMLAWFGMLILFTAYEPLSVILYETTMLFTDAQETVEAMAALQEDPLVLAGAAVIDDNLARIQAVYFTLQMGLVAVCGVGGISLFVYSKRIGGGLSDSIVGKVSSMVRTVQIARLGR